MKTPYLSSCGLGPFISLEGENILSLAKIHFSLTHFKSSVTCAPNLQNAWQLSLVKCPKFCLQGNLLPDKILRIYLSFFTFLQWFTQPEGVDKSPIPWASVFQKNLTIPITDNCMGPGQDLIEPTWVKDRSQIWADPSSQLRTILTSIIYKTQMSLTWLHNLFGNTCDQHSIVILLSHYSSRSGFPTQ